jgi:hypothetical protein
MFELEPVNLERTYWIPNLTKWLNDSWPKKYDFFSKQSWQLSKQKKRTFFCKRAEDFFRNVQIHS